MNVILTGIYSVIDLESKNDPQDLRGPVFVKESFVLGTLEKHDGTVYLALQGRTLLHSLLLGCWYFSYLYKTRR